MRLARTVASLAAGMRRSLLARGNTFKVRVFIEIVPDLIVFVAGPAPRVASHRGKTVAGLEGIGDPVRAPFRASRGGKIRGAGTVRRGCQNGLGVERR